MGLAGRLPESGGPLLAKQAACQNEPPPTRLAGPASYLSKGALALPVAARAPTRQLQPALLL
eukprot:2682201-Lingulodinium_polyedra.AAC.1